MPVVFESRMQHNYMQLMKDSLGSRPTWDFIWQSCREGERRKERPYFSQVRGKNVQGQDWLNDIMCKEKWKVVPTIQNSFPLLSLELSAWSNHMSTILDNICPQDIFPSWCLERILKERQIRLPSEGKCLSSQLATLRWESTPLYRTKRNNFKFGVIFAWQK